MNQVIREYRSERNLQLKDLAAALGVTEAQLSRLELGKRLVTAEMAIRIETATEGAIARWKLRPDLWEPPLPQELAS